MQLKLQRPICFFDLETTGIHFTKDRIVEIAILKIFPNGKEASKRWLLNPEMPIPPESTQIHGITDAMVAEAPTFKAIAPQVNEFIGDADIGGFNSDRFDIPILAEEMLRVGVDIDLSKRYTVDVQTIFHKMEKRTLAAAYQFYCGKELEEAHTAAADTRATYEVLLAQLDRYPELENDIRKLSEFTTRRQFADMAGLIAYDDKDREIFTFGKYKNRLIEEILEEEPGYFGWMLNAEFPLYTKKVLTAIKLRKVQNKLN